MPDFTNYHGVLQKEEMVSTYEETQLIKNAYSYMPNITNRYGNKPVGDYLSESEYIGSINHSASGFYRIWMQGVQ
jgi:hypothetical protein